MIGIGLQVTNINKMERWILEECRDRLKACFGRISIDLSLLLYTQIKQQPEWQSLEGGKLRSDFGIPNGLNLDNLLNVWAHDYNVKITQPKISGGDIRGGITIGVIDSEHNQALRQSAAHYSSKGGEVDWLNWLLFAGDSIVVRDYHVIYGLNQRQISFSRTGKALMAKRGNFKVDSAFSGTEDNNFITRAMDGVEDDIFDILQKEIENNI